MTTTDAPTGLGLVRGATDRLVLESVIDLGRRTRAEIAQATGVSKPTVSESVRRLGELGVLCEAGRQEGSRGRAGTYYELSAGAGLAVALHAGPHLVVGESLDVRGDLVRRVERPVGLTVTADELLAELAAVLGDLVDGGSPAEASIAVSGADPVERRTGRLVHLQGSPFVLGEACVRDVVGEAAEIDNDVHWAAVAELAHGRRRGDLVDTFLQPHLGSGIGGALVADGRLVRGARGLASHSGGRIALSDRKNTMGSLPYCRNTIRTSPQGPPSCTDWRPSVKRTTSPVVRCGSQAGDPGSRSAVSVCHSWLTKGGPTHSAPSMG